MISGIRQQLLFDRVRWICLLFFLIVIPMVCSAQCDYNEGASPTFNISGNTAADGYSTVVIAADHAGVIKYFSSATSRQLQNMASGKYQVYSFNYRDAAPASLAVGANITALVADETCTALSAPISIGVCKCTDEISSGGTLNVNFTSAGQTSAAGYTQQYLLLGADAKISSISGTPAFTINQVNTYQIYGVNYKTAGGIAGLAVGSALTDLSGDCFALSNAIDLNVCPTGALPVKLVSFHATPREQAAELSWTTSEESNSDHFEVQRSTTGKDWSTIGVVGASGDSDQNKVYAFRDASPFQGRNLYRLKMIDLDHTFAYSTIREVQMERGWTSNVYPNPVGSMLYLKLSDPGNIKSVEINNLTGIRVYSKKGGLEKSIDVSKLSEGMYILRVTHTDGSVHVHKFVHIQ